MKRFVSVFLFGAVLLVLVASVVVAEDVPAISAKDLVSLYRENEIRFNRNYKDKRIRVSGELVNVSMTKGAPSLTLQDGSLFGMFVYCRASEMDAAADFDKGDTVVVVGKCDATLGKITLEDCVIVAK